MVSITVNGQTRHFNNFNVPEGEGIINLANKIDITNDGIIIEGLNFFGDVMNKNAVIKIVINGDFTGDINTTGSVVIAGNVEGNINTNGEVKVGKNVEGNITTRGNVTVCEDVEGNVMPGGNCYIGKLC